MEVIFMNRLARSTGQNEELAQVWIGEEEGAWHLGWSLYEEGDREDIIWYEGSSWEELMHIYRHQLALQMSAGFRPLLQGLFHEIEELRSRNYGGQRLQCYSELYANETLYEDLCAWRRKRAASDRKAPYFIATNRLLRMISSYVPLTMDELMQLPGVGESKASEYGQAWLELTNGVERSTVFPLDWVYSALKEEEYENWLYRQKEQKYKQELDKFKTRKQVLEGMKEGHTLEEIVNRSGLSRRELIELLEILDLEGYDTDCLLDAELAIMPEQEQEAVWSAYEELGDTFLKPVLHKVYGEEKPGGGSLEQVYEKLRMIRIRYRRHVETEQNAG
ncbi:HRDC domain-containing protein [Paenibacillus sp. MER 99-2]|uniref:HRDC domain-containing protein n=1 Tax=Paenibacillus sp. MER 99-2 TaxID=2939572 RepID=UPI00203C6678|nr:HRDC domain-containing protein [Paenibacillus sp. MER 99-2]MCM3173168.1 HRDC domain-containing protein [Paenibacillus sp. MER 99-2]